MQEAEPLADPYHPRQIPTTTVNTYSRLPPDASAHRLYKTCMQGNAHVEVYRRVPDM